MNEGYIHESDLERLIPIFYSRVRRDELIGPVFNEAVGNWPEHLEKLVSFWSSVMLATGRYKGSPMAAHLKHRSGITPEMFARWLEIWRETTAEIVSPMAAAALQAKAERIAESLSIALFFRLGDHPDPQANMINTGVS